MLIFIKLQANFASDKIASGLELVCPMPPAVQRVSCDFEKPPVPASSQSWDWQERARRLVWKFKRISGGTSHTLKVSNTGNSAAFQSSFGARQQFEGNCHNSNGQSVNGKAHKSTCSKLSWCARQEQHLWTGPQAHSSAESAPSTCNSQSQCTAPPGCKCGTCKSSRLTKITAPTAGCDT